MRVLGPAVAVSMKGRLNWRGVQLAEQPVYDAVTASSASPTTMKPVTAPPRKATCMALFSPTVPACAVRTLARTATFMPM